MRDRHVINLWVGVVTSIRKRLFPRPASLINLPGPFSPSTMVDLSRFRRRREQQPPRFYDKPSRERHFLSIIGSVLSVVLLIVAIALREWAKASDSKCAFTFGLTKIYLDQLSDPPNHEEYSSE